MRRAGAISTPPAARRCPASATAIRDVRAAMHRQLDKLAYAHTSFFTTDVAEELAERLIADAPAGIGHVYLVSGGSEAIEAALKLARQYFRRDRASRSAATSSRAARAITATRWARSRSAAMHGAAQQFAPLLIETTHVVALLRVPRPPRRTRRRTQYSRAPRAQELEAEIQRARAATTSSRSWPRPSSARPLGAVPADAGLFQAHPRDLRPPRRAADPRRGDVRHGPHRHAARAASRKASRPI